MKVKKKQNAFIEVCRVRDILVRIRINRNKGFSCYFCLMMEGSGSRSVYLTYESGWPKNLRIGSGTLLYCLIWYNLSRSGFNESEFETLDKRHFFCTSLSPPWCLATTPYHEQNYFPALTNEKKSPRYIPGRWADTPCNALSSFRLVGQSAISL